MLPGETDAVGAMRVEAYQALNLLGKNTGYANTLRVLGFDGHGTVLVAVEGGGDADGEGGGGGDADGGKLLGTVMLEPWHGKSEVAKSADEVEVRALAVAPWAQGRGTGRALMLAVIDAAAATEAGRLLLSTRPEMAAAMHLYQSLGFVRSPELDWEPVPGVALLGFALPLR